MSTEKRRELIAFGQVIRRRREQVGLSQEALSLRAGLHRTYIGHIERGGRNVSLLNILCLADALETTANDLLRDLLVLLGE